MKWIRMFLYIITYSALLACHNRENKNIENVLSKIERNASFRLDSIEKKS